MSDSDMPHGIGNPVEVDLDKLSARTAKRIADNNGYASDEQLHLIALIARIRTAEAVATTARTIVKNSSSPRVIEFDALLRNAALDDAAEMVENLIIYTGPGGHDPEKEQIIIADKIRRLKSAPPDGEHLKGEEK